MPHGIKYKQDKLDELGRGKVNFIMFTRQNAFLDKEGYVEMSDDQKRYVYENFVRRLKRAIYAEERHKVLVYRRDPDGYDIFSSDHHIIAREFSQRLLDENPDTTNGIRYYIYDQNNSLVRMSMHWNGEGFIIRDPFSRRI